jgi:type IV fimbrial biogenesis protein FimT
MHPLFSSRRTRLLRGQAGVSLIELIAVVLVMALIAAMGIPRFTNFVSALRASGAANQLASDIAYTRMFAVREGRSVSLTVTSNVYAIAVQNADGSVRRTLRTVRVPESFPGTTVTGDGGNGVVAFDSRGLLRAGSTTGFTLARLGRRQHLGVSLMGRVVRDSVK